jgi:hypothetical protein
MSMTPAMHASPVSLTPAKHRNSRISLQIIEKIEIVSGQVYWAQEEQFDEKNPEVKNFVALSL